MFDLESLQSLERLQMDSMQAYGQMGMQMDMQIEKKMKRPHAYHVLYTDAAHGACLDALKSGTKLVALLLDHSPSL